MILPFERMLLQKFPYHTVKNNLPDFHCFVTFNAARLLQQLFTFAPAVMPVARFRSDSGSPSKGDDCLTKPLTILCLCSPSTALKYQILCVGHLCGTKYPTALASED